jgi:MOSC domain-containing protein YiiM
MNERMAGHLVAIFTTDAGGEPMVAREECRAIAGVGLEGDRYATKTGAFSATEKPGREVTLIARESIAAANGKGVALDERETRRNLVTEGIDLDALIGKTFAVGDVVLVGVRDCPPCAYLEGLTRPGVRAALEGGGGLRAAFVTDGLLRVGDEIAIVDRDSSPDSGA